MLSHAAMPCAGLGRGSRWTTFSIRALVGIALVVGGTGGVAGALTRPESHPALESSPAANEESATEADLLACPPCDDGNACTTDYCNPQTNQCVHVPVTCDDRSPCTTDSCNPATGCQFQAHPDGEVCSDGTACTTNDHCESGRCTGPLINCNDGNACTYDDCVNTETGCASYPIVCNDNNGCTTDFCNPATGLCEYVPQAISTSCSDGNTCTTGDHCVAGPNGVACVGTNLTQGAACDDGQPCTSGDHCAGTMGGGGPLQCQGTYMSCDDGNACLQDYCDEIGQCHHDPFSCDDGNPCTTDSCSTSTGCVHTPHSTGGACDDGEGCTVNDACTQDPRDGLICKGTPTLGATCNDSSPCTYADQCVAGGHLGAYCSGTSLNCNDNDPCTNGSCGASGQCVIGPTDCNDYNSCTVDACNSTQGGCQWNPLSNGSSCDDSNSCTTGDVCQSGSCSGTPLNCDDGNGCTDDSCLEQGCVHTPHNCNDGQACTADSCNPATGQCVFTMRSDGTQCVDFNPCTTNETCQMGVCTGVPVSCDDGNPCTNDNCDFMFGCYHNQVTDGTACSDGNLCTLNDACASGQCTGQPIGCSDGNPCTNDVCNPGTGLCVHTSVLGEVTPIGFTTKTRIQWSPTSGGTEWNTYRGTIPSATLGSRLPGLVYNHVCYESADAFGDGATTSTDTSRPAAGTAFYYDITEESFCGEGPLGKASSGAVRPNFLPCPTPP